MTQSAEYGLQLADDDISAEHHPRRFGYSHRQNYKNKTFKKRKNRALLTLRRSQKHYEIATTFCQKTLPENNLKDG